jgi:hypothetical protein
VAKGFEERRPLKEKTARPWNCCWGEPQVWTRGPEGRNRGLGVHRLPEAHSGCPARRSRSITCS